jgi:DNA-binding transcriptional regulator LsrR (DeoR family)
MPSDAVLFRVVDLFFREQKSANDIAKELGISREAVYPLIAKARERDLVRLVPPQDKALATAIASKFGLDAKHVTVVNTGDTVVQQGVRDLRSEYVAAKAADIALELIKEIGRTRDPVTLGLGPGRATLDFSKHLCLLLRSEPKVPKLRLVAISSGCPADTPEYASTSFFNLFPQEVVAASVGLFSETLVTQREFEKIRRDGRPGVGEAFAVKDEIDVVATAMGATCDEHDLLRQLILRSSDAKKRHSLIDGEWVGNVQYRSYSKKGPILQRADDLRAVTLFELSDFADWATRRGKHVILMARTCGLCGKTKAQALQPLLSVKSLKVWSELVTDVRTVRELVAAT